MFTAFLTALTAVPMVVGSVAAGPRRAARPPIELAGVTEQPDARSAMEVALKTNRRIEVAAARSPNGQTFALPSGRFQRDESLAPQRARRDDGTWGPIDNSLTAGADGMLRPVNSPLRMEFSGGGSTPLMTVADASGKGISLGWPKPLPTPVVAGNVATYPEVLPGVDLAVRAESTGPRKVFVVKTAAAAANPALREIALTVKATGLTLATRGGNSLVASDAAGKAAFVTPPMAMWDATPGVAELGESQSVEWGYSTAGRHRDVGVRLAGDQLLLTPDAALLADPKAVYPLRIDPVWQSVGLAFWLLIDSSQPDASLWNGGSRDGTSGDIGVGRTLYGSEFNLRSFVFFDTSAWKGKSIYSADLHLTMSHAWSWSCNEPDFPMELVETYGLNGSTSWNNQNVWGGVLATTDLTHGNDDGRAQCRGNTDLVFNVQNYVQRTVNSWEDTIDFGLRSRREECVYRNGDRHCPGWRRFLDEGQAVDGGAAARLSVVYNDKPNVPGDLKIQGKACTGTVGAGAANDYPVTAVLSDPNPENIHGALEVRSGSSVVFAGESSWVPSGTQVTWRVPASTMPDGEYQISARTGDEWVWGDWTPVCTVRVDKTLPATPTVQSTDYPSGDTQQGSVGRTGMFQLRSTSTDVVKYRVGFVDPPTLEVAAAASGGVTTVAATPPQDGPLTLFIQAVDAVGNLSDLARYRFSVRPGTDPVVHWTFGEQSGTTAGDTPYPANPTDVNRPGTLVGGVGWTADPIDARLNHDRYVRLNGASRITTAQPAIDTTKGYTVAAWVRLPAVAPQEHRMIVTQEGDRNGASYLQYDGWAGRWRFSFTADRTATTSVGALSADPPRVGVWTHVAGTYDPMTRTASIYVDGTLSGTVAVPATWNADRMTVGQLLWPDGAGSWHGSGWNGDIDEVRVYDRVVQPAELITFVKRVEGWYGFHDGNRGSLGDRSGYGRSGEIHRGVGIGVGFDGHGGVFTGLGEAVVANPNLRTDRSFTTSAWVRLLRNDATQTAVSLDGSQASAFRLQYDAAARRWAFALPGQDAASVSSTTRALSTAPPKTGEWTHLTGVYDAANKRIQLWVNGTLEGSATVDSHWAAGGVLAIGRAREAGTGTARWYGDIDEVVTHTGALNALEIGVLADADRRIPAPQHLTGDFTHDGKADTVIIHGYPNKVMKLWALADSGGTPVEVWNSENAPWEMPTGWQHDGARWMVSDFDGDHHADIAVVVRDDRFDPTLQRWIGDIDVWVFRSNGVGFDPPSKAWESTDGTWSLDLVKVSAGDVTGDGRSDLVVLREQSPTSFGVHVLAGGSGLTLAAPVQWFASASGANPRLATVEVGDVDNDGKADLVRTQQSFDTVGSGGASGERVTVYGHFSSGTAFAAGTTLWQSTVDTTTMQQVKPNVADVNGDGRADVVHYLDGNKPRMVVFTSTGRSAASGPTTWLDTQTCGGCVEATGSWAATALVAGDVDGDGRTDLVALKTTVDGKPIRLYTIRSTGSAYEQPVLRYTSGPDGI